MIEKSGQEARQGDPSPRHNILKVLVASTLGAALVLAAIVAIT